MPDISLCGNSHKCPLKNDCYRATAKSSTMQSFANYYSKGTTCGYFMMKGFGR